MYIIEGEEKFKVKKLFVSVKNQLNNLVKKKKIDNGNMNLWFMHEIGSFVQLGWEDGLVEDAENLLQDLIPEGKYRKHDEPKTDFRYNFFEHGRSKLLGTQFLTLLIKDGKIVLGKYQDLYLYCPFYKNLQEYTVFYRICVFEEKDYKK